MRVQPFTQAEIEAIAEALGGQGDQGTLEWLVRQGDFTARLAATALDLDVQVRRLRWRLYQAKKRSA